MRDKAAERGAKRPGGVTTQGHIIDERYEIKEKIDQGGFGAVYRVYDKVMQIDKALKLIPEPIVNDRGLHFVFLKELSIMSLRFITPMAQNWTIRITI